MSRKYGEYKSEYNRLTAIHQKLRRLYGKAKGCVFCGCSDERRYEWSLIKGHKYFHHKLFCCCHKYF